MSENEEGDEVGVQRLETLVSMGLVEHHPKRELVRVNVSADWDGCVCEMLSRDALEWLLMLAIAELRGHRSEQDRGR